ncbi:MAG TPA: Bax inhibitor-1/YccA family protein [Actinomycetes bacterium]|nr:Bax inhibitor-1/YccA family protein [Actinomycetes bacterium]
MRTPASPSMRSHNPALRDDVFTATRLDGGGTMTVQGTVNKTALLLVLAVATATASWVLGTSGGSGVAGWVLVASLAGLGVAIATIVRPRWSPVTAPIYALVEGVVLGVVSMWFEAEFPGIAIQAVALTFGVMGAMLVLYTTRVIKVTQRFRTGVIAATLAIAGVYLVAFLLGLFGVRVPFLYDASPLGILISLAIVAVAALNLVLDFDLIERGARSGAPAYMEWYAAFGLLVTLVWLYLELLRLLGRLRR